MDMLIPVKPLTSLPEYSNPKQIAIQQFIPTNDLKVHTSIFNDIVLPYP
jgi:hypothetical protein